LLVGLVRARRPRQAVDDRMRADGVDPETSAVVVLREQKLTGPRGRKRVANGDLAQRWPVNREEVGR
jgi:hypothetical protein